MGTKATWRVTFTDGTTTEVKATSQRMAKAKGAVKALRPLTEVNWAGRINGHARNGKRPRNPNRSKKAWQRAGYSENPRPREYNPGSSSSGMSWW